MKQGRPMRQTINIDLAPESSDYESVEVSWVDADDLFIFQSEQLPGLRSMMVFRRSEAQQIHKAIGQFLQEAQREKTCTRPGVCECAPLMSNSLRPHGCEFYK